MTGKNNMLLLLHTTVTLVRDSTAPNHQRSALQWQSSIVIFFTTILQGTLFFDLLINSGRTNRQVLNPEVIVVSPRHSYDTKFVVGAVRPSHRCQPRVRFDRQTGSLARNKRGMMYILNCLHHCATRLWCTTVPSLLPNELYGSFLSIYGILVDTSSGYAFHYG